MKDNKMDDTFYDPKSAFNDTLALYDKMEHTLDLYDRVRQRLTDHLNLNLNSNDMTYDSKNSLTEKTQSK